MTDNPILTPAPEGGYVAHDPVTAPTSQGDCVAGALANLREAVALYREESRCYRTARLDAAGIEGMLPR